jgi:hypothetical protein
MTKKKKRPTIPKTEKDKDRAAAQALAAAQDHLVVDADGKATPYQGRDLYD